MIQQAVAEDGLVGDLMLEEGGQPRKAILMLGGSEGGKAWSSSGAKKIVEHLTNLGYALFSLAYFKSPGLPETCEEIPLEYFEKAIDWLANQPQVIPDEAAIIGASKGGEVALILGSMNAKIKAIVALSPSSVVWQGVPKMGGEIVPKSSWTYAGKPLPYVPFGMSSYNIGTLLGTLLYGKLRKVHEKALQDAGKAEAAAIPVEKIQGAVLLLSGKRDKMWHSSEMCDQMMKRLDARGFSYPHMHIAYEAGHNDYLRKVNCQQDIDSFLKTNYT